MVAKVIPDIGVKSVFRLVDGFKYPPDDPVDSPQNKNGFTRIPHDLFEEIITNKSFPLSYPLRIFLAVLRETAGFNRVSAEISTLRFLKLTGITHRNNVYKAIKIAIENKMIKSIQPDCAKHAKYSINNNFNEWKKAIRPDCAIQPDCKINPARLQNQSSQIAVCILKKPLKKPLNKERGPTNRRHQLPPDFSINESRKEFAVDNGIPDSDVQGVFDHFRNYHQAKGSIMKDWDAAWRTWVHNDKKYSNRPEDSAAKWAKVKAEARALCEADGIADGEP